MAGEDRQRGQATVELVLVLPVVVLLALLVAQAAALARDQLLVLHAAREAARAAAVDPSSGSAAEAAEAAADLDPDRLSTDVQGRGERGSRVTAVVRYRAATSVPLVGALLGDVTLRGSATMRVE
jgi:Flp pilus assembly protein TadG